MRQKSSKGDLYLEWDACGRLIKSRNTEYTAEFRYDALGRRIQKRSKHHHTGEEQNVIYGWDGNTLAFESNDQITKHYVYEKDSFVPLLQAIYREPIELVQTPDWTDQPYHIAKDPLWRKTAPAKSLDNICFYHCDHLGTPQEMSDAQGQMVWKAEYKAWGERVSAKSASSFFENSEIVTNNIRFQGQYFDEETGLHYNRYRYYSPYVGRFISKDPIGLLGGNNVYAYAPNPVSWIDPLGLNRKKTPAQLTADRARSELGKTSGAAADLQVGSINISGISGRVDKNVHPQLKKALNNVPEEEQAPWHGNCAEVDAINKALKKGINVEGATIDVVNINSNDKRHGTHKPACSSCNNVLKQFGVNSSEK
ncbi:hypothetical protein F902_03457 [Acinetobacter higginsii]|uniref:RHS protein conserved region domain-containing protein n=1 Tax=Acinetobacter higginsii TaxID=70347 RepID=N9SVR6_9GAMM|nr:hypothetical protein F902_03457 [Acinetobacter higginsii]